MLARHLYRHSRYFALIVISVLAVGSNSFQNIARQEDPTLTNFVASITTFYPGASPERVEALVTRPLEDELRKIAAIDELHSVSSTGVSYVSIALLESLPDQALDLAWSEIRDAMADAQAQFPTGVGAPDFDNDRLSSFTAIVALSAGGEAALPLSLLNRLSQDFADQARNLPGTKLVETFGEPREEIRVEVDAAALMARGLSLEQVAAALHSADAKMAAGRATGAGTDLLIEMRGDLDSLERVRDVIVSSEANGRSIRISDLARVYKAAQSPPSAMAFAQGRDAILVGALMESGQQVDAWSARFRNLVEQFEATAPGGLHLEITYDQSGYTSERLAQVGQNLVLGIVLVILVLLVTLGWRAAIVVAVILPLCGLVSIAVLEMLGIALQQMSVVGLIVALGLLVDGSIVMTDEIRKHLLQGHSGLEAIGAAVQRLRTPLIASALTTILAFVPMAIMPGPGGDFLGSIAVAVITMLTASTVLALVVTPVLAAWLLPRGTASQSHWYTGGVGSGRPGKWLAGAMDWSLRRPWAATALALSLPVTGFLVYPTLTAQFFPGTDRDQFHVQVKLADGRSIYDSRALAERLDQRLRGEPLVRRVDWSIGESPPAFYYNMYRTKDGIPTWAEALVLTQDAKRTDALIRRLQTEFNRDFPEARIVVRGINQGPPVSAPIEVELKGNDLAVLRELGAEFRRRMDAVPDITHTSADLIGGAPKIEVNLDDARLRLARLQLSDAAVALNDSLTGRLGGEVLEGTERLPVRVRLGEQEWSSIETLADIRVPMPDLGGHAPALLGGIPLNALGTLELVPSHSPISRFNGERINTVEAFIRRGVLPEMALRQVQEELARSPIDLPPGYSYTFRGDSDSRTEMINDIVAPLGLILSALLATLVLTFNSWRMTALSVLVCTCSIGLSLLSLALFGYPFGVQAMIGVIGSVGVSINAAIIIVTALQQNPAASAGGLYAIRAVVMDSSRHIVSTTATTFGGFLPLMLEDNQFWPPFAMAIGGGVLLSTIISFFLVPPLFLLLTRSGVKRSDAAAALPTSQSE